jgi:hypothetical protein
MEQFLITILQNRADEAEAEAEPTKKEPTRLAV